MYATKSSDGLTIARIHDGEPPPGADVWPVIDDPVPAHDATSQRVAVRGYAIVGASVRRLWQVETRPDQEVWDGLIAAGYLDPVTNIRLKLTESARLEFTGLTTQLMAAETKGVPVPSTITIWDHADQPHTLSLADYYGLVLRGGFYYKSIFDQYAP